MLVIEDMFCFHFFFSGIRDSYQRNSVRYLPYFCATDDSYRGRGLVKGSLVGNVNITECYPCVFHFRVLFNFSTRFFVPALYEYHETILHYYRKFKTLPTK